MFRMQGLLFSIVFMCVVNCGGRWQGLQKLEYLRCPLKGLGGGAAFFASSLHHPSKEQRIFLYTLYLGGLGRANSTVVISAAEA